MRSLAFSSSVAFELAFASFGFVQELRVSSHVFQFPLNLQAYPNKIHLCVESHLALCRTLYLASSCILAALSLSFNHKHLRITYKPQTYLALCASPFLQLRTIYIVSLSSYKVPLTLLLSSECVLTTKTPRTCIKCTSRPVAVFMLHPVIASQSHLHCVRV
jgi:hypothetical protein